MKFVFSSPGKPDVIRTTEKTFKVLRVALSDTVTGIHTAELMQELRLGIRERYLFRFKGVEITVRMAPAEQSS